MKYLLLILLSGIIVTACKKENAVPFAALKVGSCEAAVVSGGSIKICLDSVVSDSRCPTYAVCVWRGAAAAVFSLSVNDASPQIKKIGLKGFEYPNDSSTIVVQGYKITFKTLSPYPGDTGYSVRDVRAGLEVIKL